MKRYRESCPPPKVLSSNWIQSDVIEVTHRPYSYAKGYHCWQVIKKGGHVVAEFKREATARAYACGRGYTVKEFALPERAAHNQKLRDMELARWNSGYGA